MAFLQSWAIIGLGLLTMTKAAPNNRPFDLSEMKSAYSYKETRTEAREGGPGMLEGDMDMARVSLSSYLRQDRGGLSGFESAVANKNFLWPGGKIPYMVSDNFDANERQAIIHAIQTLESKTCVRFHPRSNEVDFVYFKLSPGVCISEVGRVGGLQNVGLGAHCSAGVILHELLHVIGFFHEQSRTDRDTHVVVLEENIEDGKHRNFDKYNVSIISDLGFAYDYGSIMHYASTDFSKDQVSPTIVAPKPIGQRKGLSDTDIRKVNKLYNCSQVRTCPHSVPPQDNCITKAVARSKDRGAGHLGAHVFQYSDVNMTVGGKVCQRWDAQSPHRHSDLDANHNFCRNPDGKEQGPWCYTTDPNEWWNFCFTICNTQDCFNPGGVEGYSLIPNIKSGEVVQVMGNCIVSAEECQAWCRKHRSCNYFTYNANVKGCWMFQSIKGYGGVSPPLISGPKECGISATTSTTTLAPPTTTTTQVNSDVRYQCHAKVKVCQSCVHNSQQAQSQLFGDACNVYQTDYRSVEGCIAYSDCEQ